MVHPYLRRRDKIEAEIYRRLRLSMDPPMN